MMISSAASITWLLVTTKPSSEITKPEPKAELRRGRSPSPLRSRNSRKKSSKGEPSGTMGEGPAPSATTVEVVMLTTAGLTRSARSAKLSGRACATSAWATISAMVSTVSQIARGAKGLTLGVDTDWPVTMESPWLCPEGGGTCPRDPWSCDHHLGTVHANAKNATRCHGHVKGK